jgi:uncharacterized membrane protein YedE/YeeE
LVIAIALFLLAGGAIALSQYGWKHSLLFLIGGFLGVTLYHSSFGFASAYRKLFVTRNIDGMLAQIVMLAVATLLFVPTLAAGSIFGQDVKGAIAPVGVQGAIGAILFGIGMQLGGACGCGTLYTMGSGSLSMIITLITFCLGAFGASLTRQWWAALPATSPISLSQTLGWVGAVFLQLGLFALAVVLLKWWHRTRQHPDETKSFDSASTTVLSRALRGPWSLVAGAIALAVLNWLTLILSGQPWRITWGFALWAAQALTWLGWNPANNPFWSQGAGQIALSQGVFGDVSSVMNFGIVLGAVLAAALAGRLMPKGNWDTRAIGATVLGGLIMGYGAFIGFGCNVSAYFSGIASTSVHGWVWIIAALVGTVIGLRLRPLFRLPN